MKVKHINILAVTQTVFLNICDTRARKTITTRLEMIGFEKTNMNI